jgi:hypothetical protein
MMNSSVYMSICTYFDNSVASASVSGDALPLLPPLLNTLLLLAFAAAGGAAAAAAL